MSDNTMMVLRETRDLALATVDDHGSLANNMLEALTIIHSALDNVNIPNSEEGASLGIVGRVKRLIGKGESDREKLVVTDDLHNQALETVESQKTEIEKHVANAVAQDERAGAQIEVIDTLTTNVEKLKKDRLRQEAIEIKNKELQDELERVKLERDELRDERDRMVQLTGPDKQSGDQSDIVGKPFQSQTIPYRDPFKLNDEIVWKVNTIEGQEALEWSKPKVDGFDYIDFKPEKKLDEITLQSIQDSINKMTETIMKNINVPSKDFGTTENGNSYMYHGNRNQIMYK